MTKKLVKEYYTELGVGEWERLTKTPYNRLELDTTLQYLDKHLPPEGHILDAGCGPGRYTVTLARQGYALTGLDLTAHMLEIARGQAEKAGVMEQVRLLEGTVEDLSMFEDDAFDAVMCLGGPLSHLVYEERRQKAVDELIRVAKSGAPIFASVIGRLAVCMNSVVYLWPEMLTAPDVYRDYTQRGYYPGGHGFAPCHFYLPEEFREEFKDKTEILEMVGLEGIFSTHEKRYNEIHEQGDYNDLQRETHLATCTHPSIVGISEHFMIICRKHVRNNPK
jgi:ubiquinone/menaquinone biosynthesis C-methylase UbiE